MNFNITAEEEAVLFRVAERLDVGKSVTVDDLAAELGGDVRALIGSLAAKGWIAVNTPPAGPRVSDLSPAAWMAVRGRRDAHDGA